MKSQKDFLLPEQFNKHAHKIHPELNGDTTEKTVCKLPFLTRAK